MKALIRACYIVFLLLTSSIAFAQTDVQNEQLAIHYYNSGEFDKAVVLYEKLYNHASQKNNFYKGYYNSLVATKKYDEAIKIVQKQIKKSKELLSLRVDLANAYTLKGDAKNALAAYEDAIKLISPDQQQITDLANALIRINELDYALQVYEKGKKVFLNPGLFNFEIAAIYQKKNDLPNMIRTYLDMLENNPADIQLVQNQLQEPLQQEIYQRELQSQLYKRIQKYPDIAVFSEMLIWNFIQKKDFESAFIQVKALDRRNKENGNRVFQFAQSAFNEGYYEAAKKAYQFLIDKGKENPYYLASQTNLLNTQKTIITLTGNYTNEDLLSLEINYDSFIKSFGKTSQTLQVMRDYASFEAKYLHNINKALDIIQQALQITTPDRKLLAYCKLDFADYQLITGEIWESTLLYSQVDKAFKEEPLGEEARFKNAKLSYYNGDFEWAQTQLDVLKGSTQELISNDAIALSVFITDNLGLDTTSDAMNLYARADLLIFQNKYDEALKSLDTLILKYPQHSLADDVLFTKARLYLQKRDFAQAAVLFQQVDKDYSFDLLGDDALFAVAQLYENQLHDKQKAMDLYKQILSKYKGSVYVIQARKKFRELRGDQVN